MLRVDPGAVDALSDLYRSTRPANLDRFTATIQLEDYDYRRTVHQAIRRHLTPFIAENFVDHRVVAGNYVVKQPGPWVVEPHQDFDFLDASRWTAVLGWIALHDVDPDGGCLHVVPGSHRLATLPRGSGDHRFPFDPALEHLKAARSTAVPLQRGEVVVYDARALHWSTGNAGADERVAAAFAAIPRSADLLHYHVNVDDTVTVLAVDDDVYADTPFHSYPVRGEVLRTEPLDLLGDYDAGSVDLALAAVTPARRRQRRRR